MSLDFGSKMDNKLAQEEHKNPCRYRPRPGLEPVMFLMGTNSPTVQLENVISLVLLPLTLMVQSCCARQIEWRNIRPWSVCSRSEQEGVSAHTLGGLGTFWTFPESFHLKRSSAAIRRAHRFRLQRAWNLGVKLSHILKMTHRNKINWMQKW